jgi:hypothetical protein
VSQEDQQMIALCPVQYLLHFQIALHFSFVLLLILLWILLHLFEPCEFFLLLLLDPLLAQLHQLEH